MNMKNIVQKLKFTSNKNIVVLGDFCLDKYIYSSPEEDDVSVESGMPAWQIYNKKTAAGVAGTITNNLCALGAHVTCVGIVGDDGEGYDLCKELKKIGVDTTYLILSEDIVTATYLKTMRKKGEAYEENLRFDFRNRQIVSNELLDRLLVNFKTAIKDADGVVISDQFYERNSGVVGDYLREKICEVVNEINVPVLVDSRAFASKFKNMYIKCNNYELMKYCGAIGSPENLDDVFLGGKNLKEQIGSPIFITCNKDGIFVFDEGITHVPTYPVSGPIDVTGAGDASNAGIIIALSSGLTPTEAAMAACAVSSITIEKIGETGTASMDEVIKRLYVIDEMMK